MQILFEVGQAVRAKSRLSGRIGTSLYRIVQLLPPADREMPLYRVRSIPDGVEWVVAQDRIAPHQPRSNLRSENRCWAAGA